MAFKPFSDLSPEFQKSIKEEVFTKRPQFRGSVYIDGKKVEGIALPAYCEADKATWSLQPKYVECGEIRWEAVTAQSPF